MWKELNPLMKFCHNQNVHSVMKKFLFHLMMGYELRGILLAFEQTNAPTTEQRLRILKEARNKASAAHELARQKVAKRTT
jgi:hypothetical protein